MTVQLKDITAVDWSPKLAAIGEIVPNLEDINQCIRIILTTPRGSRPHEPLFGSDLWKYIDYPANVGIPRIIREAIDAVTLWEPRAKLTRVVPAYDEAGSGHITLRLEWTLKEYQTEPQTVAVTLA